jgi:hypothetical protein
MNTDMATTTEKWQRYGDVEIVSGQLLLADLAYLPDLLPQIESAAHEGSADLREIAQILPTGCEDGTYTVWVLRDGDRITGVHMDLSS